MAPLIRVLVVDDHPVVASGAIVELRRAGFDALGPARDLGEAIDFAEAEAPDVIVCDVMLGDLPSGLDLPARLRGGPAAGSAVLFLSSYDAPFFLARAVRDGAAGYLRKSATAAEIAEAVRAVASGGSVFPASAVRAATTYRAPTPRELDVIALVAEGLANGEIGSRLGISDKTVETYLRDLFIRYGLQSRTQLATYARDQGWLAGEHAR